MVLKLVVLAGLAYYLYQANEIGLAFFALASMVPFAGLMAAFLLVGILIWKSMFIPAAVLGALIAFNLIGNYVMKKRVPRIPEQ